ncbi:MAG: T9SS type A sorting domain-containing protein, partial [Candidatus Electryoneaceae bacterium]|nr:T9SS type A sorting domain-containing protein [Candidatus Electryoneaceae bacterium]
PEELARLFIPNKVQDFVLQDSILFTIVRSGERNYGHVVSIDVTDPTNPTVIGGNPDVFAKSLFIQDTLLFVVHALRREMSILDATDPVDLPLVGAIDNIAQSPNDIAIIGDRVFLSDTHNGLIVVDIADPARPRLIGNWDVGTGISVAATRDFVFLGDHDLIHVFDAHPDGNYNTLREIGEFALPGRSIRDMKILGNLFYIASSTTVQLLRFEGPGSVNREPASFPSNFVLHPPYPNPFNSTTTISYTIPISSQLSLQLYDLSGRRVMTLFDGYQEAGIHSTTMTATDLPSGLYFLSLEASEQTFTRKVMLIK